MNTLPKTIVMLLLAIAVAGCTDREDTPDRADAAASIEVGYIVIEPQAVPRRTELSGRVVALATAEIRPQVNGIVQRIAFQEGRQVAENEILYELNDAKFKAAYASAEAALKKAQAATVAAQATFNRSETLAKTNAVSAQTLDDARSTLLQAQADEEAAKADLQTAQINLDNAIVRAPIAGIIGVSTVSVGSLVTENQTDAMATIRQIDPIHVDLVDSSANLLRIRDEVEAGRLGRERGAPASVTLTLENGRAYAEKGEMTLADMVVSQTTGTFSMRARFPNPDRILIPGMFVRASVDLGSMPGAFLVPQRAVTRSDDGTATVYVVSADDRATQKAVSTSGTVGNDWIVINGVQEGDRLIVDGFQKISDGTAVKAVEAGIDDDGVVKQTISTEKETSE
ncbi:efflux RND transporter periplasmic adaptor subunit [Mesorhizobium sp. SB112]|uniref:efflux RND transporter periplasmic adaptor subunit n=1 Tax=Mesorhizobium sp. SB112 TaxID=3151853 RepID=UPI0032634785